MTTSYISWTGKASEVVFALDFFDYKSPEDFTSLKIYEENHPKRLDALLELYNDNPDAWISDEINFDKDQILTIQAMITCLNTWYAKFEIFFSGLAAQEYQQNVVLKKMKENVDKNLDHYLAAIEWWDDDNNRQILSSDLLDRIESALGEESHFYQYLIEYYEGGLHDDLCDMYLTILNYFDDEICNYNLGLIDSDGDLNLSQEEFEKTREFLASKSCLKDFHYAAFRFDQEAAYNC